MKCILVDISNLTLPTPTAPSLLLLMHVIYIPNLHSLDLPLDTSKIYLFLRAGGSVPSPPGIIIRWPSSSIYLSV